MGIQTSTKGDQVPIATEKPQKEVEAPAARPQGVQSQGMEALLAQSALEQKGVAAAKHSDQPQDESATLRAEVARLNAELSATREESQRMRAAMGMAGARPMFMPGPAPSPDVANSLGAHLLNVALSSFRCTAPTCVCLAEDSVPEETINVPNGCAPPFGVFGAEESTASWPET